MMMSPFSAILAAFGLLIGAQSVAAEQDFSRTLPADAKGSVEITNVSGAVRVDAWDRPEIEVRAELGSGIDRIDFTSEGGRAVVRVVRPRNASNGDADLTVKVPAGNSLTLTTVSADIVVGAVLGAQRLQSVSGSVETRVAQADVEVKTVSGDITLAGSAQPASMRVSTVSGGVRLTRGAGSLETTTISGDIEAQLSPARAVRLRTTSGDLTFDGKLARGASFEAESVSGDLTVKGGAESGFRYEASSFSGDIDNCFGAKAQDTRRYGPGSRLDGTRGAGDASVRLKTMSGDIEVCDK